MKNVTKDNPTVSGTVTQLCDEEKEEIENFLPKPQNTINDDSLKNNDRENLTLHNEQYTILLKTYVENFKKTSTRKYEDRTDVFQIATTLLIVIPLAMFIFIGVVLFFIYEGIDFKQILPIILTAITTVISSLFVILKIIVEYLFDRNEEKNLTQIISEIQKYDSKIRDDVKEKQ